MKVSLGCLLPGMKDFVSVRKNDGSHQHVRKRLILCNLKELYSLLQTEHEKIDISFSKFAQLRPAHCVLAGSSGTHTVCFCTYHENVKLMLNNIDTESWGNDLGVSLKNYHDWLNLFVCSNPTSACYLGGCKNSLSESSFKDRLIKYFEDNEIDEVKFESWTQTDRCSLSIIVMSADDFAHEFCQKIMKLKSHGFIAKEQLLFLKRLKDSLQNDEFIISFDFAENYAFVLQNSAQSFH